MVKISDCGCCDCDSKQEYETVKERALSSVNKVYTTEGATFYPDGTGMVTLPIPTNAQIAKINETAEAVEELEATVETLDTKIDTTAKSLTDKIAANASDITAVEENVEDLAQKLGGLTEGVTLYRAGEGKVKVQLEATDGSLIDSNTLDMVIPYQYDLISGTTSRSFKLRITMSDGAQYDTNDFVIPEGGGTDVTVTGIVLSKDTSDVNRIHVQINLSDSTMIDSGYISMVDSVGGTVTDGKLTITVNGVESSQVDLGTKQLESDITNVLTVANRAFDAVSISGSELTLERGNGGTETVTLPGGSDGWEELDLSNLPTDFSDGDIIAVCSLADCRANATSWSTKPTLNSITTDNIDILHTFIIPRSASVWGIDCATTKGTYYILNYSIGAIQPATNWNNTSSNPLLFTFNFTAHNAGGWDATGTSIMRSTITTYVKSMWRKKTSS